MHALGEIPEWSSGLAYAVGLITTDGNLSPDGRHLGLVSKDYDQVELFQGLLNLSNRISQKNSGFNPDGVYWYIQFGDIVLYRWLVEIGLMPNKSKSLAALDIPGEFFFDFLRGHLDGDGNIRSYDDPVYPSSQRLYIVFHSASLRHLQWIQETVERLIGLHGYIEEATRVWRLYYAKSESLVLLQKMYHHDDVPCLKRKRELIEKYLQSEPK